MNAAYMFACGIVWRKTGDNEAGSKLVEGLESRDPDIQFLARLFLVDSGESSLTLLESAVAAGDVDPDSAGPIMAEILSKAAMLEHDPAVPLGYAGRLNMDA